MNDLPEFRANPWAAPAVTVREQNDGTLLVTSEHKPKESFPNVISMLDRTVAKFPERRFLAERNNDEVALKTGQDWRFIQFDEADNRSDSLAAWLLSSTPVAGNLMVLSHNTIEHALVTLAGMKARFPVAPVSPNYALLSHDFVKLKAIFRLLEPKVIFVQNIEHYWRALNALDLTGCIVLYVEGQAPAEINAVNYADAVATEDTAQVSESKAAIQGDDVAKILFTSGSTGEPKGVINTHTNLCFTQGALLSVIDVDEDNNPPVLLDWMPWHHTYGGNQNFHRVIKSGGTLYIDDGKPLPGHFEKTLHNIKTVPLNNYTTVPAVYALLVDAMEGDQALRSAFFKHMDWCSYGGSDMPQETFEHFQQLAIKETGQRISMITALGATESAAITTIVHWPTAQMGSIGLPIPGTTLKLIPREDKFELCVKGPQITPGYYKAPDINKKVFDEDGYFHTGDAVRWSDPTDPARGLRFVGRVSEDFKLLNGTWVHTSMLRIDLLSCLAPLVQDVVITGQDKPFLGAMVWLNEDVVKRVFGLDHADSAQLASDPRLRARLQQAFCHYNMQHGSASTRIERALILLTPPSLDKGEMSDKRSVNQRKVQILRADRVADLYTNEPPEYVFTGLHETKHQAVNN